MKRVVLLLLILAMMVPLSACGDAGDRPSDGISQPPSKSLEPAPPEDSRFDLDGYKALVSDCRTAIRNAGSVVAMMGVYEYYYWEARETTGGDDMTSSSIVDAAYEWLRESTDETRETVAAAYESIRRQYGDITLIEIEGREAEEIDAAFRKQYMAYSLLYSLAATPAGCRISFLTMIDDYNTTITQCDNALGLLLGSLSP